MITHLIVLHHWRLQALCYCDKDRHADQTAVSRQTGTLAALTQVGLHVDSCGIPLWYRCASPDAVGSWQCPGLQAWNPISSLLHLVPME